VYSFEAFLPFILVNNFCTDIYRFFRIFKADVGQLSSGNIAVHAAHIAVRLAVAVGEHVSRPALEFWLRRSVVKYLVISVNNFLHGAACDCSRLFIYFSYLSK
jgi:hypothetical protein